MDLRLPGASKPKKSPQNASSSSIDKSSTQGSKSKGQKKKKKSKKNKENSNDHGNNVKVSGSPGCTPTEDALGQTSTPPSGREQEGGDSEVETATVSTIPDIKQTGPASSPISNTLNTKPALPATQTVHSKNNNVHLNNNNLSASFRPAVKMAFSQSGLKRTDSNRKANKLGNRLNNNNNQNVGISKVTKVNNSVAPSVEFNESLRWEYKVDNEEEEEERLRVYKLNRRKRYLAAHNAAFPPSTAENSTGSGSSSRSSLSYSPTNDITSARTSETVIMETPRSMRLDDIHLDAVG